MNLCIAHARIPARWIGPWVYLGQDYLVLHRWEERLSGARQSLSMDIRRAAECLRPDFLGWIERQREENNDSLHWWMSHLAGRNNMVSMLFLYICQIEALQKWLRQHNDDFPELLVICEDGFLLQAVVQNLASDSKIRKVYGSHLGILRDWGYWILRIGYCWLREPIRCWRHWQAARKTRATPPVQPNGSVVLMHQCLDDKAFRDSGRLVDRYFTVLPEWIEKKGYTVVRLPWMASVNLPIDRVYKHLRRHHSIIIEDYLSLRDYFDAFRNHLVSIEALSGKIKFPGLRIAPLVLRERLQQVACVSAVRFWLYQPALARWCREITSLLLIDTFEGMFPAHVQIKTLRERVSCFTAVGYYHVLISRGFLGYHFPDTEWQSSVMPDELITNGELGRIVLIRQGVPAKRLVAGPALRQQFNGQMQKAGKREALLILLALDQECCVETMVKLNYHAEWIRNELHIPVKVKTHPMMRREVLLTKMGWHGLPTGWEWVDSEIQEALGTAHCCIALGTASAYDAIIAGCIVLPLERELGFMGNYLDLLEDEYDIVSSVPYELIRQRLEEIFISRREYYAKEFAKIRIRLIDGLNPINDEFLQCFLPDHFIRTNGKHK